MCVLVGRILGHTWIWPAVPSDPHLPHLSELRLDAYTPGTGPSLFLRFQEMGKSGSYRGTTNSCLSAQACTPLLGTAAPNSVACSI